MKKKRDLVIYVQDILNNMILAEKFLAKMDFKKFVHDEKTNYAVSRCLEIMGEAAKQIPPSIRQKYPEIPWRSIAGMRDVVIHEYFGIDLEKIWVAAKKEFPTLKPILLKICKDLEGDQTLS